MTLGNQHETGITTLYVTHDQTEAMTLGDRIALLNNGRLVQAVDRVNAHVVSYLERHGIGIAAVYVCPHERASGCHCIKPNPYFLRKAEHDFGIDLTCSFVIGDHPHDIELAVRAGATGIYVLSGHGVKHRTELPAHALIANGIQEATDQILEQHRA